METRIYAVIPEMTRSAKRLTKEVGEFSAAANGTRTAADKLAAGWEGDARNAFVQEQDEAFRYYTEMIKLVKTFTQKVENASKAYTDTDNRGAQILRRA